MEAIPTVFLFLVVSLGAFCAYTTAADTIGVNQTITDGQTIVSAQKYFELGFFRPDNSSHNRYLGIWYKCLATGTVVWVANRDTPISSKSGELTLHPGALLVLRESATNRTIWSSKSAGTAGNQVAQLLDSGNLMVIDSEDGPENYIWQSFDHPGDTFLPGMKFGRNLERGVVTNFTSWKSVDDPSQGPYMVYIDFSGLPQIFGKNGDVIDVRVGSWNGLAYTGSPSYNPNPIYKFQHVSNEKEIYSIFELINSSVLSKITITPEGSMERLNWINRTKGWFLYSKPLTDTCDRYALCGAYGSCDILQSPTCGCLRGFKPKRPDQWNIADWTGGCRREISLDCGVGKGSESICM